MRLRFRNRIKKIASWVKAHDVDAILVLGKSNIKYFAGIDCTYGAIIISGRESVLLTDVTHFLLAESAVNFLKIVCLRRSLWLEIGSTCFEMNINKLAFDPDDVSYLGYWQIKRAYRKLKLVGAPGVLLNMRKVKSRSEITRIKQSCAIGDAAFKKLISTVRPGMTERDLAAELDYQIRNCGGDRSAFDTIVLSGIRTQFAHAMPSAHRIKFGECVLIDFGVVFNGYHSDCTRILRVGSATGRQKRIYKVVLDALEGAMHAVKPGVKCYVPAAIASDIIESAGLGPYFQYSIGHGVGLDLHEYPVISKANTALFEPGMVFTLEPGVFIPGWGGIRIEDMIRVTDLSFEILTNLERKAMFEVT